MFDLKKSGFGELEKDWEELCKALGVGSFEELRKGGVKDKTKLIPVKKQITREGRSVMTTVYVSPEEAKAMNKPKKQEPEKKERTSKKEDQPKEKKAKPDKEKSKSKKVEEPSKGKHSARIHAPFDTSSDDVQKEVATWKDTEANKALKEVASSSYLVSAHDSSGNLIGVGAFKREKDALVMSHFGSSGTSKGSGKTVVMHLIDRAKKVGLGVEIDPPKGASALLASLGFEDNLDGKMTLSKDAVAKFDEKSVKEKQEKDGKEETDSPKKEKKADPVKAELRTVRKTIGSSQYRKMLAANGIKWETSEHQGVDTMRASMAAAAFIKSGGKLDLEAHTKEENAISQRKEAEKEVKKAEKEIAASVTKAIVKSPTVTMEYKLSPAGNKMLFVNGTPRSIRNMDEENLKVVDKLMKETAPEKVYETIHKFKESGKMNPAAEFTFEAIKDAFELQESLYKDGKYNIGFGREEAESLGEKLNSTSNSDIDAETRDDIETYTGSMYTAINRYHRYGDSGNEQIDEITERLNTLIKGNTIKEDVMLYRGAGKSTFGDEMYNDMLSNPDKYVGTEIEDAGFMSTSVNPAVSFDGELKFEIKTPKGTNAFFLGNDLSSTPWEAEVLFPTNTKMKIASLAKKGDKLHIVMEVI